METTFQRQAFLHSTTSKIITKIRGAKLENLKRMREIYNENEKFNTLSIPTDVAVYACASSAMFFHIDFLIVVFLHIKLRFINLLYENFIMKSFSL